MLSLDRRIQNATSHYIDDIAVDTSQVSIDEMVRHLAAYGLETKPVEDLCVGQATGAAGIG